ncbi:hypothetical protein AWC21_18370 [Mycolicibacterium peregrinum]|nr:hypothetical protein AWC21_18370 [Mycolicibacterium peregrinum]
MNASDRMSDSLIAALSEARIPAENHEFIRDLIDAVGIDGYRVVDQPGKPYVAAARHDGGRDLHIYYGATNGFVSEAEAMRFAPDAVGRGPSSRKGTWYVLHPVNQARVGGERARNVRRTPTYCDCGMELSLTGVCSSCD